MTPDTTSDTRAKTTFRYDLVRGTCQGLLEAGTHTFILLIAVRVFDASPAMKALLAGAGPYGLLLTPLSFFLAAKMQTPAAKAAALFLFFSSVLLVLSAWTNSPLLFVAATLLAYVCGAQQMPFLVHIYADNYASHRRGSLLSNSIFLAVLVSAIFGYGGGRLLDADLERYRDVLLILAGAAFLAACAVSRMPSKPVQRQATRNPLENLSLVWKDKIFGWMLFVWMLMGIGNLMTLPLRVEYMAQPRFGIDATNTQIAMMTAVIPAIARLLTTHLWGYLFDRLNFIVVRSMLNLCFLVAILLFFNSRSMLMLGVASMIFGLGMGGGQIVWQLWVTKVAPEGKAAAYMSVHTFTTGLRGVLAPFLGFYLITVIPAATVASIAAILIAVSLLSLTPVKGYFGK